MRNRSAQRLVEFPVGQRDIQAGRELEKLATELDA